MTAINRMTRKFLSAALLPTLLIVSSGSAFAQGGYDETVGGTSAPLEGFIPGTSANPPQVLEVLEGAEPLTLIRRGEGYRYGRANNAPALSAAQRNLLRLKAMHLIALSEGRTADAEALQSAINVLEPTTPSVQISSIYITPMADNGLSASLLRGYTDLAVRMKVTGTTSGTIWGSDYYTDDSPISTAAVHAGLVQPGETAEIMLVVDAGKANYSSSSRNGIQSQSWPSFPGGYHLAKADHPDAPYLCIRPAGADSPSVGLRLNMLADQVTLKPGTSLIVNLVGSTTGTIWGTDLYTDDSSLDTAAVHAGVLEEGQSGLCKITIVEGQSSYRDSSRYGVTSNTYGNWSMSYRIERLHKNDHGLLPK